MITHLVDNRSAARSTGQHSEDKDPYQRSPPSMMEYSVPVYCSHETYQANQGAYEQSETQVTPRPVLVNLAVAQYQKLIFTKRNTDFIRAPTN